MERAAGVQRPDTLRCCCGQVCIVDERDQVVGQADRAVMVSGADFRPKRGSLMGWTRSARSTCHTERPTSSSRTPGADQTPHRSAVEETAD